MPDGRKAVWSIPYVCVASFFPSLKQNFIAYRSSSHRDCIFEIHQLWLSGFSWVYCNSCCSCSLEPEIIKIGQSSHKICSYNIVNFQESTTILNAYTKKVWQLIVCTSYIYIKCVQHISDPVEDLWSVKYPFIGITPRSRVFIHIRIPFMAHVGLFKSYLYLIGLCAKKKFF